MNADDFNINELFEFSEGNINLHGRRVILHSIHAFSQFRKDLIEMVGEKHARIILTRFGYFWGEADAAAMKRIFNWDTIDDLIIACSKLLSLEGAVKTRINSFSFSTENKTFFMDITWYDSAEAIEHLSALGKDKKPVCWILIGYMSGYLSSVVNQNIYFIEDKCVGKGDFVCNAKGRDSVSWGKTIKPYLDYFRADDIKGKIKDLSNQLRKKNKELFIKNQLLSNASINKKYEFIEIRSESFLKIVELARRAAPYDSSILITGESGTGKEVLARFIKNNSSRKNKSFVTVNCGALPETLLESELFGHKAGSFTGASKDRIGIFERADNGTIFLDEIGDVSPSLQLRLLRVIQTGEFMRVGESIIRKVNIRIISATNRNLMKLIESKMFREDLYYRLKVIEIKIPPLRERIEDILPLARHFVKLFSEKFKIKNLRLNSSTIDYLHNYSWPGNIRELENSIEHAAVLNKDKIISPECLPSVVLRESNNSYKLNVSQSLSDVERKHINHILLISKGNKTKAAKTLGISKATLWRKLKND